MSKSQSTFKTAMAQSRQIDKKFKIRWDIKTRLVNLSEEVGELAHDVLVEEKLKNDKPIAKDLGADLTNLMYELFLIANHYKIDLDKSWKIFLKSMPSWAEMRNKKQKSSIK